MTRAVLPNQSPEPTAVGAGRSAVAVHVASRRWLSFLRLGKWLVRAGELRSLALVLAASSSTVTFFRSPHFAAKISINRGRSLARNLSWWCRV